jgi:ribA/ribD-fused uncharacterized protein
MSMYKIEDNATREGFVGEYAFMSNMKSSPIKVVYQNKNIIFPTAENAFQAMKISFSPFTPEQAMEWITMMTKVSSFEAKKKGKEIKINIIGWDQVALLRMERVQFLKYTQHPLLKNKLLATGNTQLIEINHWNDKLWGVDSKTLIGRNQLGETLMKLRDTFHKEVNS